MCIEHVVRYTVLSEEQGTVTTLTELFKKHDGSRGCSPGQGVGTDVLCTQLLELYQILPWELKREVVG